MTELCTGKHLFYKNRFGDLVCMKCGFKVMKRIDNTRNIWEKEVYFLP